VQLHGAGIRAELPGGWEGAIRRAEPLPRDQRPADPGTDPELGVPDLGVPDLGVPDDAAADAAEPDGRAEAQARAAAAPAPPVVHLATFPLPADRGDFGSGAVERMRARDSFVALLEYGPEEVGAALFAHQGLPRRLDPRVFSPRGLQRQVEGQAGWQFFFTEAGRPFCLYVVLGDHQDAHRQLRRIEQVLADVTIEPNP
jgi:hypothetical protein